MFENHCLKGSKALFEPAISVLGWFKTLRFLYRLRNGMSPYINFVLNTEFSLQNSGNRDSNIY
jgi:hypothetical protein